MRNTSPLLFTLLVLSLSVAVCQTEAPEKRPGGIGRPGPVLQSACRINSYGAFQEAAWNHLPQIGVKHIFLNVPPEEEVESIKKRLAKHGLSVIVMRGDTDLSQESSLQELEAQLAICRDMGVAYMFLSPKRHGAAKEVVYGRLRKAGEIAQKYGVTIVLETHPDLGTNGDVHLETMRQIDHPNVRVNFDTGNIHFYNQGTDAPTELRKIIEYVATVEIKDHNGIYHDWNFPPLGQGVVNIPEVLNILREHDYDGPVTMEIEGIEGIEWDEETTKQAIEDSVIYLRSLGRFD